MRGPAVSSLSISWVAVLALARLTLALPATVVERPEHDYDYVIVGGGIVGSVLGTRLSEDRNVRVLIIESGPNLTGKKEFDEVLVQPTYDALQSPRTSYMWNVTNGPVEELGGRTYTVPAARIMGGGSSINGRVFGRGTKRDFDDWARYLKDDNWAWENVLPYYKKSETFTPPGKAFQSKANVKVDWSCHGTKGPLSNTFPEQYLPRSEQYLAAEREVGIKEAGDQGCGHPIGGFWFPNSVRPDDFTRDHAARAYSRPASEVRKNLHLMADSTVTRVIVDKKRAVGIEYVSERGGSISKVYAKKEILLTAGPIKSPQLLQVSGIGPKALSAKLGVQSIVDLPVGENVHDHPIFTPKYNMNMTFDEAMWVAKNNKTWMDAEYKKFLNQHKGYYTTSTNTNNRMLLSSHSGLHGSDASRALLARFSAKGASQYLRSGVDAATAAAYERQVEIILASMATGDLAVDQITMSTGWAIQLKPLSRGYLQALTTDIFEPPALNYRTTSHPLDIENHIGSLKLVRRLFAAEAMKSLNPVEVAPGPTVQSDEEMAAWIRSKVMSAAHPCCGAPMGTVLDSKMRVRGVEGLRVGDISSWPIIVGAHATQSTSYAMGEKLADMIKQGK